MFVVGTIVIEVFELVLVCCWSHSVFFSWSLFVVGTIVFEVFLSWSLFVVGTIVFEVFELVLVCCWYHSVKGF